MEIISRAKAKSLGQKRYFTGKLCPHGHTVERSVSERMCVECLRRKSSKNNLKFAEYQADYRAANRESTLVNNKLYYEENAESLRQYAKDYRATNAEAVRLKDKQRASSPARKAARVKHYEKHGHKARERENKRYQRESDRIKLRGAKYRAENPDKVREQRRPACSAARARRKAVPGKFKRADVERLYQEQQGKCLACTVDLNTSFQVDHILPLIRGGTNWPNNLQLLCKPCNLSKGTKTMAEWMTWKAQLFRAARTA